MVEINKKFGFYGTMKNQVGVIQTKQIWNITLLKISEMYPEKKKEEIIDLLNSPAGRHFADELTDMPDKPNPHVVMLRIALLNRLKFERWWAYFYGVKLPTKDLNKRLLYKNAIENQIGKKRIRELMASIIGCANNKVWENPRVWLNGENTTTKELEIMWSYIQEYLTSKRIKHGYKRIPAKKTENCRTTNTTGC